MPQSKVKVNVPKIKIDTPKSRTFWKAVGLEVGRNVRQRTESGKDADNSTFRPYAKPTVQQRAKRGRTTGLVNLTDTGRMLGAIASGIRETTTGVRLILSGAEGAKAWHNMVRLQRRFFAINRDDVHDILKAVKKWMKKKNNLK